MQRELALELCRVVFRHLQKSRFARDDRRVGSWFPHGSVTVDIGKFQDWFDSHSAELNWLLMRNQTTLRGCFTDEDFWSTLVSFTEKKENAETGEAV
jgi:hypothetical protein